MAQFKITGIEDCLKKLKELEPKVAKKVLRQALRAAMKPVKQAVKQEAPVETGALRQSVAIKSAKRKKNFIAVNVQISKGHFKGDQFYGSFQEFGTKRGIQPKHYMKTAFDKTKEHAKDIAQDTILEGILREADR